MSYYLFLDDQRVPEEVHWVSLPKANWVKVRSYLEFVGAITEFGIPQFIAYDCDLCGEHYAAYFELKDLYVRDYTKFTTKCGIDCLDYLLKLLRKSNLRHPPYILHTQNHYVRGYMNRKIEQYHEELAGQL